MIELLFVLIVGAVVGGGAIFSAARNFRVGLVLIFLAIYVKEFLAVSEGIRLGILVYPLDALFLVVFGAAIMRFLLQAALPRQFLPWFGFGLVLLIEFGLGLSTFGTPAGVAFRKFFYFISVLSYCAVFRPDATQVSMAVRWWLYFTALLAASVLLRWVADPAQLGLSWIRGNTWDNLRVTTSDMALTLAQSVVLVLLLSPSRHVSGRWKWMIPVGLATVTLLQHRSVWLAASLGIAAAYFVVENRAAFARALRNLAASIALAALAAGLAVAFRVVDPAPVLDSLRESYVTGVELDTTAAERLNSWQVLVKMWWQGGPTSWLIGAPFGTSVVRDVVTSRGEVRQIGYGAHNAYVEILFYTGLVGLSLFLAGFAKILVSLRRNLVASLQGSNLAGALLVIILMQMIYYIPYGIEFSQALWLGLAAGLVSRWKGRLRSAADGWHSEVRTAQGGR